MKLNIKLLLFFVFVAALFSSISIGRFGISLADIMRLGAGLTGLGDYVKTPSPETQLVFWNIRFPRILMSIAVGSGISIAGVVFQSLFRNPLAAPHYSIELPGTTARRAKT